MGRNSVGQEALGVRCHPVDGSANVLRPSQLVWFRNISRVRYGGLGLGSEKLLGILNRKRRILSKSIGRAQDYFEDQGTQQTGLEVMYTYSPEDSVVSPTLSRLMNFTQ